MLNFIQVPDSDLNTGRGKAGSGSDTKKEPILKDESLQFFVMIN